MKNKIIIIVILLFCKILSAQEKKKDTTNVIKLKEVVVTGQIHAQSINKSVVNVSVITAKDIQNLAATTLPDVINQYLNITTQQDRMSGRSTVSLFGLDANYFKILVDNIPMVNEAGFGNNTDLSQINLNDVEQIEIVEGSMGVSYGANAVSGVLNIITKKSSKHKWNVSATAQEETVGKEFAFFDKGRHIQYLKASHNFNDNWFVSIGANRNDFRGFQDDYKGKNLGMNKDDTYYGHYSGTINYDGGIRGYNWLPEKQLNATALIAWHITNFNIFYKFEYFKDDIFYYERMFWDATDWFYGKYRYANDKIYHTNRYYHHLNATGKLFSKLNYNVSVSHQKQQRDEESFKYNMWFDTFPEYNGTESKNNTIKEQSMEVLYSRGTLSNFFSDKSIVDLQIGYELANNLGFSMESDGAYSRFPVRKRIENYDVFASAEIKPTDKFSILPGVRYSEQSLFKDQYAASLGLKYVFDKGIELRGSYGRSFRTPTFQELYQYTVFGGHYYVGNENLRPETSNSLQASIKKISHFASGTELSNNLTANFLDVNDRIDMAYMGKDHDSGVDRFHYTNINKYRMWNISTINHLKKDNWAFNLGADLIGISQKKIAQGLAGISSGQFLYSFNLNTSATYTVPKWKTSISAYYKYNGRRQQFVEYDTDYAISVIDPSNWLDASIRKSFFRKNQLQATIGARNLLNVLDIKQTNTSGPHGEPTDIMLAYGRSYFLKLTYDLNIN